MSTDSSNTPTRPHRRKRSGTRQPKPRASAAANSSAETELREAHEAVLQLLERLDDLRDHVTAPSDPDQYLPDALEAAQEAGYLSPRAPELTELVWLSFKNANPLLTRCGDAFRGLKIREGEIGFRIGPVEEPSAHDAVLKFAHFVYGAANLNLLPASIGGTAEPEDRDQAIRSRIGSLAKHLKRHKIEDRLKIEFAAALQQARHPTQVIVRRPRSSRKGTTITPSGMPKNRITLGQAVKYLKQLGIEIAHRTLRDWTRTKRTEPLPYSMGQNGKRQVVTLERDNLEEWVDRWLLSQGRKPRFGKGSSYETASYEGKQKRPAGP